MLLDTRYKITKPNLNNDKLIYIKTVTIGNHMTERFSKNIVCLYEVKNGEYKGYNYYVFEHLQGEFVQNFDSKEYEELSTKIKLTNDFHIFTRIDDNLLGYVPLEYRYDD